MKMRYSAAINRFFNCNSHSTVENTPAVYKCHNYIFVQLIISTKLLCKSHLGRTCGLSSLSQVSFETRL